MSQTAKVRERPGVRRTFTEPFLLRFSEEQMRRVDQAARGRSKTVSDFIRDATMTYVIGVEDERDAKRRSRAEENARAFIPQNVRPSRGLGLGTGFGARPPAEPVEATLATQPTIIIQNAPAATASTPRDEIDILADYVASAKNRIDAEERGRVATNVIRASTASLEEQKRIAKALDDRIALKTQKEPQKPKLGWDFLSGSLRK